MIEGLLAPVRVVLQRSLSDWLIVAATWLVVICATTLVAVGLLYGDAVALTGLRQSLDDQPPTATSIYVQMRSAPSDLAEVEAGATGQVERALRTTGGEITSVIRSESYALPADAGTDTPMPLALFGAYAGIERHAALVSGAWPESGADPIQAAVSVVAAEALGVEAGGTIELTSQRGAERTLTIEVSGLWEPADDEDPYWRGDALELGGTTESASFRTHGPLVVSRQDLVGRVARSNVTLEVRAVPDFDRLTIDDIERMRADAAGLERRLEAALGPRSFFQVTTELPQILDAAGRSLLVSRSGVVLLTIQFAVLAGYALLLVAGLLVEQRRVETALLRSRGAGVGQVVLLAFLEALLLVVPAAVAAPWLALAVLGLLNVAGPLADAGIRIDPRIDDVVLMATAGAAAAAVVALVLPALAAGRGLATVRQTISRQGNRTLAQRLGLDLALVVLAGIGIWQLRTYGAPLTETVRGEIGLDPLLVAAPAIGLLAGAILALRIVPLAAEMGERLLARQRGLVAPLGARQLARRPLRYTRSALLLMLAASLGTFAGAYASTWTQSQEDQAGYRTGADVRVEVARFSELESWEIGAAYRSVEGVEAALPVAVGRFDLERSGGGRILALDSARAAGTITFRPDLADQPLEMLMTRLAPDGVAEAGVPIDGAVSSFAIEITADLEPLLTDADSTGFSSGLRAVVPTLLVRDGDGVVHHLQAGRLAVGGGRQSIEVAAGQLAAPVDLLGVEVRIELPDEVLAIGAVRLEALEVVDATGAATPVSLAGVDAEIVASEEQPIVGFGPVDAPRLAFALGATPSAEQPVPALASERYLELTGVPIGDVVTLGQLSERRSFEIVGSVRGFPTLDPTIPFVVADLGTLATVDAAAGRRLAVTEWWLATAEGRADEVAAALAVDPYSAAAATSRTELHRTLLSDPVALGLIGALVLGAVAAVIFATIGFFVSATVSTQERLGEFALLQAIGLSHRQQSAWVSLENAFLLLVGLLSGTALGLLLAWVVLPFVTLTQEAALAVPPVEVVIPWAAYGLLYLVALVALGITVLVIGRLLARVRVSGVLRSGGE